MPKRISIAPHLSEEELYQRYRTSSQPRERTHYQIIWLLVQGKSTSEVASLTGYSRSWIYELVWGYNRLGAESLGDKRVSNRGAKSLLDDSQQALLWKVLQDPPPDGGLWSGPKVAAWMSELLGVAIAPQRGWEYLCSLKNVSRRPRNAQIESDPISQQQGEKNWRRTYSSSSRC